MFRILTTMSAVAGLIMALNVSAAGAQNAGSAVAISIRALGCTAEDTCDEALAGVQYTAAEAGQDNGVGATTGADGRATLSVPLPDDAGTTSIVVVGSMPEGYERYTVSCVDPETGEEVPTTATDNGIVLDAEPGDLVTCDWFYLPADGGNEPPDDGSLTVQAWGCPAGFDGESFAQCEETPLAGVRYTVVAAGQDNGVGATTDADGVASFPLFAADLPGDINLYEVMPGGYASVEVSCVDAAGQPVNYVPTNTGITLLGVQEGADIACDWYHVPADDPGDADGSLTIQKYACPEGFEGDDYAECRDTPQGGVHFTSFRAGTDNGVGATTDADGVAVLPLFAADLPGDISIYEDMPAGHDSFAVACVDAEGKKVDFEYDNSGITLLDVEDGAEITCEWFNIPADDGGNPKPTPTAPPRVDRLPDTGAGASDSASSGSRLLAGILIVGVAATALVAVGRRRSA